MIVRIKKLAGVKKSKLPAGLIEDLAMKAIWAKQEVQQQQRLPAYDAAHPLIAHFQRCADCPSYHIGSYSARD